MINEEDIPNSWEMREIGDIVVSAKNGGTPRRSTEEYWGGDIPWLSSGEVRGKYTTETPDESITEKGLSESSAYLWPEGSVLVAMYGRGTIGRPAITSIETAGNQAICGLIPDEEVISNEYLYYWLENIREYLANKGRGATASRQNLNRGLVLDTEIPVPPLEEQEKIIQSIENQLGTAENLSKSIDILRDLISEYRDSLVTSLIMGHQDPDSVIPNHLPTEDDVPNHWSVKELGTVVEYHSNLITPEEGKEYDLIELGDIEPDAGKIKNIQTKMGEDIGSRKRKFGPNHVLYCKLRPYLNKVVMPDFSGIATSELLVFEPTEQVSREYLYTYLSSPVVRDQAEFLMKGANQPRISKSDLLNFNIPIPPKDEQSDLVNQLENANLDSIELHLEEALDLLDEYRDSVLAHAFTENDSADTRESKKTVTPSSS